MTKAEILAKVAKEIKVSKAAAAKALAVITSSIAQAIKKGEKGILMGRNPRTGKEIKIDAKKVPRFSAGAALKTAECRKTVTAKPKAKKVAVKPKKK